jgi:uncharacterized protein (DUF58 family)
LPVSDPLESALPDVGLMNILDPETGETFWVDTSDKALRKAYEIRARKHADKLKLTLSRAGVDSAWIGTDKSYIQPLSNLFKRRGAK